MFWPNKHSSFCHDILQLTVDSVLFCFLRFCNPGNHRALWICKEEMILMLCVTYNANWFSLCKQHMLKLVNRSLFASHWYSIHFRPLPASHSHYLMCIVNLHFICFCVVLLHECQLPPLKPILFLFLPFHCPPSSFIHTLDEQPVKVKRKKSFNLSRKFPFYKSKENIVQELVESEREYQPCDPVWGGGTGASSFPFHAFILSFNFHLSAHLQGWLEHRHSSHPPLTVPERSPTHWADMRPKMWWWGGTLWCVSEHLSLGFRGVSGCVCVYSLLH